MKTFRIRYTVIEGGHGCSDEFFVTAKRMSHERAVQEIADAWPATPEQQEAFRNELLAEGYGLIPDDVRAVKDVCWEETMPVIVTVRGGAVREISGIPEGVRIKVVDWDAGASAGNAGPAPAATVWGHGGQCAPGGS